MRRSFEEEEGAAEFMIFEEEEDEAECQCMILFLNNTCRSPRS